MLCAATGALAIEPIKISRDDVALDLSGAVEIYQNQGENFQVSTAPGPDGIVRRIEVEANDERSSGDWAVFALANTTDQQLDRLIVAPHFRLVNSGLFWPDLGSSRIAAITPSEGFALDRQASPDADVFLVTLNPGAVVTFIAELASPNLPQVYLWDPEPYKDTVNSYTLFRGIVIGIAGLLALFLTILFVVKGTSMFPATAALSWAVLAYICVDFGFLNKVIEISPGNEQIWRAGTEVGLAATFVVFLFAYLNLNRWHGHFSYGAFVWICGLLLIAGVAIIDPAVAAGIARLSFAATAITGIGLIVLLGIRGYDRAIMLIPSWVMVLIWLTGSWMTITGMLDNDIVQPALGGGLILIILLIGFTVMQHAFAGGALHQGLFSDMERQALAVVGSGDIVWDWDVLRDRVVTKPDVSLQLGLPPNSLGGPARNWLPVLHSDDRDTFRTTLDVVLEHRRGRVTQSFRLRGADGHYHWFSLRARPVVGSDGEVIRCVGTLVDVTEQKKSEERLLHDAVHDNLTGLPNRELFMNRLEAIISVAKSEDKIQPTVFVIDIDRFKQVNDGLGISAGDTILLTIARRLHRLLKPKDSLSRFAGDQFALMLLSEQDPARIAGVADAIKQAIRAPINFAKREIVLTASIGLITWTNCAEHRRGHGQGRRARHAPGQALRRRPHRAVPARLPLGRHRPAAARIRSAPRHRAQGIHARLPADRAAGGRHRRRLRGAAALGASAPRLDPAVRLHPGRRELRPDRPARPVRHAARGGRSGGLAEADRRRAAFGFGQPVEPAADPPRPRQRRALGDRAREPQAALLPARTHRIAGDGQSRADHPCADQAEAARHRPVARRFRHRLFVAVLSDAVSRSTRSRSTRASSTTRRRSGRCCSNRWSTWRMNSACRSWPRASPTKTTRWNCARWAANTCRASCSARRSPATRC